MCSNKLLIFCNILLKIVEYLEFLIESDQSIKLVLHLHLFVLELELQVSDTALLEHTVSEAL